MSAAYVACPHEHPDTGASCIILAGSHIVHVTPDGARWTDSE